MEKLIKLINKRQEEKHPDGIYLPVVAYRDWIFWSDSDCLSSVMDEIHLISKPCRFIEWLVEGDKINFESQAMQYAKSDLSKFFTEWKDKNWMSDDYAMLLMLLAIQDEPTEFLISVLK